MGSSHSKPSRRPAYMVNSNKRYPSNKRWVPSRPIPVAKRCNTFLAAPSFGRAVHLDPRDMEMQKVSNCIMCRRRINKELDDIVLHNVKGCQAVYHSHCIRRWIEQNFIDRRGREMRPHCFACQNTMNIRVGPGRTRQNPMGFYAFANTARPAEVSGWC